MTERKVSKQAAREQKEAEARALKVAKWKLSVAKRPYIQNTHFSHSAALSRVLSRGYPCTMLDGLPAFLRPSWVPLGTPRYMNVPSDPLQMCKLISETDYRAHGEEDPYPTKNSRMKHDYMLLVQHALETLGMPAWMIPQKGDFSLIRDDIEETKREREEWKKREAELLAAG